MISNFTRGLAHLRESKCEAVRAVEYEEPAGDTIYSIGTLGPWPSSKSPFSD